MELELERKLRLREKLCGAVYKTIANHYNEEIKVRDALSGTTNKTSDGAENSFALLCFATEAEDEHRFYFFDHMNVTYLRWRLAYNLYKAKLYYDAIEILQSLTLDDARTIAKCERGSYKHFMEHMTDISLTAARCCYKLFLQSKSHYHLEHAYGHYQNALTNFRVDMSMYLMLPPVLIEFARLLEHYGAFPAATEIYNNLLRTFPTNREYFTILYRCSIVGTYVSELDGEEKERADTLNQCIDVLQFLLEALPDNINEVHVVLVYAKALELSKDIGIRFRAPGIYQSLYDICRNHNPPIAKAKEFNNHKVWLANPQTWLILGDRIAAEDEPLLARYCYDLHVEKVKATLAIGLSLGNVIGIETCLKIGKNYASFQDYEDATKIAEMAFSIDHFHKETRHCLALWSHIYQDMLDREERSISALTQSWKERVWTSVYRKNVKKAVIKELEAKLSEDRFEEPVREQLAYYATDRWRSRFLFENECARRIQAMFRERRKIWRWQDVHRAKYLSLSSQAYAAYRKKPYDIAVRNEVRRITDHRLCPKKHAIKKIREIIDRQDIAVGMIRQTFKTCLMRWKIHNLVAIRNHKRALFLAGEVLLIQKQCRRYLALKRYADKIVWMAARVNAARTIQRFIRWRNKQFQHAVTRIINRKKRKIALAHNMLLVYFVPLMYRSLLRLRRKRMEALLDAQREEKLRLERLYEATLCRCAKTIQRFIGRRLDKYRYKYLIKSGQLLKKRKSTVKQYTTASSQILRIIVNDDDSYYEKPGVRQSATPFILACQKTNMYCDYKFTHIDCMMLSGVLKHKSCKTSRLVLHEVDARHTSFEFDLVPAIGNCKSLRCIYILSGTYTELFMVTLLKALQEDNPRCVDINIEDVQFDSTGKRYIPALCISVGMLMRDYFNYAIPGLSSITLHKCSLRSADMKQCIQGIQISTSLKRIVLSYNLIEDEGFIDVVTATVHNTQKTQIHSLDFTGNLIKCSANMRNLLNNFGNMVCFICEHNNTTASIGEPPPPIPFIKTPLELLLSDNMISLPYELPLEYKTRNMLKITGIPSHDDMLQQKGKNFTYNNLVKNSSLSQIPNNTYRKTSLPEHTPHNRLKSNSLIVPSTSSLLPPLSPTLSANNTVLTNVDGKKLTHHILALSQNNIPKSVLPVQHSHGTLYSTTLPSISRDHTKNTEYSDMRYDVK